MHPIEAALAARKDILDMEPGTFVSARFDFEKTFIGFSGHFPGYPLLPAFVQVACAACLIRETMGVTMPDVILEKAKFLTEIKPGNAVRMACTRVFNGAQERWKVAVYAGNDTAAAFQLIFKDFPAQTQGDRPACRNGSKGRNPS